jgi:predicted component of type VI protein secretion system
MTRIAVFNTNLSLAGGGEAVTLSIAKTLEEAGYIVDVITYKFDKDLEKVFELISPNYRPRRIIVYKAPKLAKLLNTRGKLARLRGLILVDILVNHLIEKIRENKNYDLIIDTSSNILTKADVIYVQNITW